jgi:hypothetical protein
MDEQLLQRIDATIRGFSEEKDRFSSKRVFTLKKLRNNIHNYKENIIDLLSTLQDMERALDKEIADVERRRP